MSQKDPLDNHLVTRSYQKGFRPVLYIKLRPEIQIRIQHATTPHNTHIQDNIQGCGCTATLSNRPPSILQMGQKELLGADEDLPRPSHREVKRDSDEAWTPRRCLQEGCRCQNWRISGRGSQAVRLRINGNRRQGTQCFYPGLGPLDGGKTLRPA